MKAYFSIYKLDVGYIWVNIMGKKPPLNLEKVCSYTINSINDMVKINGGQGEVVCSNLEMGYLYFFFKSSEPSWLEVLQNEYKDTKFASKNYKNISNSFILLTRIENNIYATTGGYAGAYVKKFITRSFGLNILPKMFEESDSIIEEIHENHMVGIKQSTSAINREFSAFKTEKDFTNIFRRISSKLEFEICDKLGIIDTDMTVDEFKGISLISSDALNIKKKMSMEEFRNVLKSVDNLDNEEPNFALNYFISNDLFGITKTEIEDKFFEKIISDPQVLEDVLITGDNFLSYRSAAKWVLKIKEDVYEKETPYEIEDLLCFFKKIEDNKFTKSSLHRLLKKWKMSVYDSEDNIIFDDMSVISIIETNFTSKFEKKVENSIIEEDFTVYLNSGSWFILNSTYKDFINNDFNNLLLKEKMKLADLYRDFDLIRKDFSRTETSYNDSFKQSIRPYKSVICTDKKQFIGIELCDLIVFDEEETYLICNKMSPTGVGARDLLNQIQASASALKNDNDNKIKEIYYDKLKKDSEIILDLNLDDFIKKLDKPIFVSAYTSNEISNNTGSNYVKLLSIQTEKYVESLGYKFHVTSPRLFD